MEQEYIFLYDAQAFIITYNSVTLLRQYNSNNNGNKINSNSSNNNNNNNSI